MQPIHRRPRPRCRVFCILSGFSKTGCGFPENLILLDPGARELKFLQYFIHELGKSE